MKVEDVRPMMEVRNKISCNRGTVKCLFSHDLVEVRVYRGNANPYTTFWKISNIEPIMKENPMTPHLQSLDEKADRVSALMLDFIEAHEQAVQENDLEAARRARHLSVRLRGALTSYREVSLSAFPEP